jgi:hypothetical protein
MNQERERPRVSLARCESGHWKVDFGSVRWHLRVARPLRGDVGGAPEG